MTYIYPNFTTYFNVDLQEIENLFVQHTDALLDMESDSGYCNMGDFEVYCDHNYTGCTDFPARDRSAFYTCDYGILTFRAQYDEECGWEFYSHRLNIGTLNLSAADLLKFAAKE